MKHSERFTRPRSVLVIDDERDYRETIQRVLGAVFRVITANSGAEAIRVLREQQVDVVTFDSMIRGVGAIEILRAIRALDSDVQVVVVSAASDDELAPAAAFPVYARTSKPFDPELLVETIEKAAEETEARRHRSERSQLSALRGARLRSGSGDDAWRHDAAQLFSHEIKNRLSVVVGFVRLLRAGLEEGNLNNALDAIEGNAHAAVTLTMNFLHAEESDGGWLKLHKTSASLNDIVGRVMVDETPRARLRRVTLDADLGTVPAIDLDVAMISRAVTNLLGNAVHYSPQGARIDVQTRGGPDGIMLNIRDHGPGVPAAQVPHLFERYGRGAEATSTTSTGLGLYLVRRIVEAHGGSVSATFPPDGGSVFAFRLPWARTENA